MIQPGQGIRPYIYCSSGSTETPDTTDCSTETPGTADKIDHSTLYTAAEVALQYEIQKAILNHGQDQKNAEDRK